MSETSSPLELPPYQLPAESTVYRMIPTDKVEIWIAPDGTPDPAIFYRRPKIDKDGVSVATTMRAGIEKFKKLGRPAVGARSLQVGRVRAIEATPKLDVRSKNADDTHALITGVPFEEEKNFEKLADELLRISNHEPLPSST
jgi:hypothetical protein